MKFPKVYALQETTLSTVNMLGCDFVYGMNEIHVVEKGDIVLDHPKYYALNSAQLLF
jgi:hypothetical protein